MSGAIRALAVLITVFVLGGCTATATTSSSQPPATGVTAQAGSHEGNDRPQVTYDGLMVRRRVVIAIHANPDADLASLREQLDLAAKRRHTMLTPVSASVLDPAILESLAPDLVVALPSGVTRAEAEKLIDPAFAENGRILNKVQKYDVQSVLIHDLRFALATANPTVLAKAIAREGILSDALGTYTATLGRRELDIAYTGPLLSDHLVESVRRGIARPAGIAPKVVTVSPRTTTGSGVDMSREPAPAHAVIQASTGHHHGATPATVSGSSRSNHWAIVALAAVSLVGLTLVIRATTRVNRPDKH